MIALFGRWWGQSQVCDQRRAGKQDPARCTAAGVECRAIPCSPFCDTHPSAEMPLIAADRRASAPAPLPECGKMPWSIEILMAKCAWLMEETEC